MVALFRVKPTPRARASKRVKLRAKIGVNVRVKGGHPEATASLQALMSIANVTKGNRARSAICDTQIAGSKLEYTLLLLLLVLSFPHSRNTRYYFLTIRNLPHTFLGQRLKTVRFAGKLSRVFSV